MYFVMFVIFMALLIAPAVGGSKLELDLTDTLGAKKGDMIHGLFQPNDRSSQYYNDTGPSRTEILESESSVIAADRARKTGGTVDDDGSSGSSGDDEDDSSSGVADDGGVSDEPQPRLVRLF